VEIYILGIVVWVMACLVALVTRNRAWLDSKADKLVSMVLWPLGMVALCLYMALGGIPSDPHWRPVRSPQPR
jgi:hypothetical protein